MEEEGQEWNRVASGVLWGKSGPVREAITRCRKCGRKGEKTKKERKKYKRARGERENKGMRNIEGR